jgi:hypothetical protein
MTETVQYVWVDTCCIDKRSSAELSEAINSMYTWYRNAITCYVYLNDVSCDNDTGVHDAMRRSTWFTRGWTLQELLAPDTVYFVDRSWTTVLGTTQTLAGVISDITGIQGVFVEGQTRIFKPRHPRYSAALKLSWAVGRSCTRPEDRAYSLLGIFGISMPLLYGEGGHQALRRLQHEI